MSKRQRYWRRTGDPLTDDLVCPNCGENAPDRDDHARLKCNCSDGDCFAMYDGKLTWRRSPCPNATCGTCGWSGQLRSRHFTQSYQNSRCPKSEDGWHNVTVYTHQNHEAGPIVSEYRCKNCGAIGHIKVRYLDIVWER